MTLNNIISKLRKQNKGQYLMLGFCISLSVLLITSYALMYLGPTVQDFLPDGGDTRKLASLLMAVTAVGCTIFTLYASGLFFRYKSREYGVLLALGTTKKALKPLLYRELALLTAVSTVIGLVLAVPVSFGIWKLFELFLLSTDATVYHFGAQGFVVGITFCIVLAFLLFLAGSRFIRRSNIMDILREGQKTEMVKIIPSWTGKLGVILTVLGLFLGLGLPAIVARVFFISLPSMFNLTYLIALAGIYMVILSCVAQTSAGKNKEKYYNNLISISMMRFSARTTTKNMCVMALLLFCCLFASFFGMTYTTSTAIMEENASAFAFHFPADEKQITRDDISSLSDEYDMKITTYGEEEASNLVISYKQRDFEGSRYVTVDSKQAKLALFLPERGYRALTGQEVTVQPGSYKTVTPVNYKDDMWEFIDGLYEVYNPDTQQSFPLTFDGTVEYNAFSEMSRPFTYVLSDSDYQTMTGGLSSQYMERVIMFDVEDPERSYTFAKALETEYTAHTSSLSDVMGYYDAWEDRLAREKGETYGYGGSIGLAPSMEQPLYDWKYEPRLTPVIQQDFMQQISVYVMLCLYIFIIMLASIGIMTYVRSVTVASENKALFESLQKLGADSKYTQSILRKQLCKIFQYPAVIGCSIGWLYSLFMAIFNDVRLTVHELGDLGILAGIIALVCGYLYIVYRKACKKAEKIVGIL